MTSSMVEHDLPRILGDDPHLRPVLAYHVNKMQTGVERYPKIEYDLVKFIEANSELPTVAEQADNLVLWLGKATRGREGIPLDVAPVVHCFKIGASEGVGFEYVAKSLGDAGLVDIFHDASTKTHRLRLTFPGWERFEQLKQGASDSRRAFMAMDFNFPLVRDVYTDCFKPAVEATGFELTTLDENPEAGSIPNRMRVELLTARFAVVDLTRNNNGAYWEAGFAEGLGRPVIYTCEVGFFNSSGTHFDVRQSQSVLWDANDLEKAARDLKLCIRATLPAEAKLED